MRHFADNGSALLTGRPVSAGTLVTAAKRTWVRGHGSGARLSAARSGLRELTELDDRMLLSDIGLNRSDVYAVANGLRSTEGGAKFTPKA
ncbi:MAG: DUF1127 domain-containing protein [Pseudomonadota bacterium]